MEKVVSLVKLYINLDEKDHSLLSQLLFFIPFGVWLTARIVFSTPLIRYIPDVLTYNSIRTVCLAIVVGRELAYGRWDRLAFLGFSIMAGMAAMTVLANNLVIFDSICFVFAARNVDFKKLVRFVLVLHVCLILLIITCSVAGVIPDTTIKRTSTGIIRHQLGFAHPNTCPGIFFFVFCAWVYLRNEKYCFVDMLGGLAITAVLFAFTNARVSCGMTAILAVAALVVRHLPEGFFHVRVVAFFGVGSISIAALASIILALSYDPSIGWMKSLDAALSHRLSLSHNAIATYGVPLLGQKIDSGMTKRYDLLTGAWVDSGRKKSTILDCAYVRLLVDCGLPFLLAGVALSTCVCARAYRRGEWMLVLIIVLMAAHSMIETYAPYASFNAFLFLIGGLFYRKRNKEELGGAGRLRGVEERA